MSPSTQTPLEDEVLMTEKEDGAVLIDSNVKCTLTIFQSGVPTKRLKLTRDVSRWSSEKPLSAALRIQVPLENSSAMRTLVDIVRGDPLKRDKVNRGPNPLQLKVRLFYTADKLRARSRALGVRPTPNATTDRTIALMRKELR